MLGSVSAAPKHLLTLARTILLLAAVPAIGQGDLYTFAFYPRNGAAQAPGFVAIEDGPCGKVAVAKVRRLPPVSPQTPFEPEQAIEVSPSGGLIRRWPAPVDFLPLALKAEGLLIGVDGKEFWVWPDGRLAPSRSGKKNPAIVSEKQNEKCPQLGAVAGSVYVGCRTFTDISTNRRRTILFQYPCT